MPNIPKPRSLSEIRKQMRQTFVTKSGVNDLFPGSSISDMIDAAALSDFRSQGDIIATLNVNNIDRIEGVDLDNYGKGKAVPRPQSRSATGVVSLLSINFTKISTKIYAGTAAPPLGVLTINISDASLFPPTGSIYLGRGSNNIEGPIAYTLITPIGNYFQITLATPTTKNHNVNESIVLAQGGNRTAQIGTIVQTETNSTSPSVSFRTLATITIPDGEDRLDNVPVVCTELGTRGNVPANSITKYASNPFPGAGVTNSLDYVTGIDKMSDPDYRLLIKNAEQTKTKGTDLAVTSAAVGVTSSDDNTTSTSAQIKAPSNRDEPAILYIDDGTAYQPIYDGQGFEQVIDNANGGEKFLQLQNEDLTKALVVSSFTAPFALTGDMKLAIEVGGTLSEHTFINSDFATQNAADTFEIVNSINANTNLLFSARALNNSKQIAIFAKSFMNEDLKVRLPTGLLDVNANDFIGLSENLTYSLRLYKNDILLIKDGSIPNIFTLAQSSWAAMSSGETLNIKVDQSIFISYTFNDADFVSFGYATLSQTNSLASWAGVINNKIAGITATVQGGQLKLESNKGANNNALIEIDSTGSTLASKMFGLSSGTLLDAGQFSDYTLNRATGQVQLVTPLDAGDTITAGSKNTRAFVDSAEISTGSVNLPASTLTTAGPKLWVLLDAIAEYIQATADASSQITITNPSTNTWRFTSNEASAFANVQINDWAIISDDAIHAHDPDFIGAWRVSARTNSSFDIRMTDSLGSVSGALVLTGSDRITFVRSQGSMQQLNLLTGLQTLTSIANSINTQLQGGFASAINGRILRITSNTFGLNGFVMLAGITTASNSLEFLPGELDFSTVTHTAYSESQTSEITIPGFVHSAVTTGTSIIPPINIVTGTDISRFVNAWVNFLHPYGNISSNKNDYSMAADITGTAITLRPNAKLKDVLVNDRVFPSYPYQFEPMDNLVAIIDNDSLNKSLNIRMSRKGLVNGAQTPTQIQFRAYDADAGPIANFPNQFGDAFDFKDFYLYFKARQILDPVGADNKILLNSIKFGPTGESIRFGIFYPQIPDSIITSLVTVDRYTKINIFLASGPERLGSAFDSTTQFDVVLTGPNTWRYNYNGIGTSPSFVTGGAIAIGDIVNIDNQSPFDPDNTGIFKISAITNTYFEITNYSGFTEINKQLTAASDLRFYPLLSSSNKASDIQTYATANLAEYITISQLQSGAGIISTSTWEDSLGISQYVALVDGFNAAASSNIGTTISPQNQFNLKIPLQLSEADLDYTLVGQEFYLIPAIADHIKRFLNIFAVTGLSSLGTLSVSSDAGKIQIYSNLFGSKGTVLISGGAANSAEGALLSTGTIISQAMIEPQLEGLARSGASTVTVQTTDRHGLSVGDIITIFGASNPTFNGTFTVLTVTSRSFTYSQTQPILTIDTSPTGAVRLSNIVTITTTTAHSLAIGDQVTITGVTNVSFNGTFIVTSIPSSIAFTYSQAGANATSGSGSITDVTSGNGEVLRPYTKINIARSNEAGFQARQWVRLENTATQQKLTGLTASTSLSITTLNTLNITSGPGSFQTIRTHSGDTTTQFKVEKHGQFLIFSFTGIGTNPDLATGGVVEGDWVRISGAFSAVNEGIYKIEKIYLNSFYIINNQGFEEELLLGAATDLRFYSYDSIMPGDQLIIDSNILGASNMGTFTVQDSPFPTTTAITVTPPFTANQSSTPLGASFTSIQIKERFAYSAYKEILNITPDPTNVNGLVIILDGNILPAKVNISAGSGMQAVSKFNFKTSIQSGEDSYKHWLGLIHEVGKVIRGQADDPVGYPGVSASGAYIEISAPLPKRIQLSVVIRNRTGVPFQTIKTRVQSAVTSYINALGVGAPVVFSELISVVQQINGIQAVSIASPTYNSTNDQIVSQFDEKPVIVNIAEDVIVSLAT